MTDIIITSEQIKQHPRTVLAAIREEARSMRAYPTTRGVYDLIALLAAVVEQTLPEDQP